MKLTILLLAMSTLAVANPVKKAELMPKQDEPMVPGTKVPVETLNTAPTSPQLEEEDFRNTLKAGKKHRPAVLKKKVPLKE